MTHIADLAPLSYSRLEGPIRAVGWLELPHPYPRGPVSQEFRVRLMRLIERPLSAFFALGMHWCGFCEAEGKIGPDGRSSQCILLVPAARCVYEAPIWIGHYVLQHEYQPPDEFCRAVQDCPEPASDAFRHALLELVPSFRELEDRDFPFFATIDPEETTRSSPEYGSQERCRATARNASIPDDFFD